MCAEMDAQQTMHDKFYIYDSVFSIIKHALKNHHVFFRPPRAPPRRRMGGFGGTGGGKD
jgi:hypothetical protein